MTIPVFNMRYTRYPIAVLIMPNKTVEFISMRAIKGRFFVCKYGVYQVESKYAYRYGKQLIYFYDSTNGKPIDLHSVNKLMSFLAKEECDTLMECKSFQNLRRIDEEVKATVSEGVSDNGDRDSDYDVQDCVNNITSLDASVKRFVCSYSEHDDDGLVSLITEVHYRGKMFERYSKNMKSTFPKGWNAAAIVELPNRHIDIIKLPFGKSHSFSKHGILEQRRGYAYNSKRQQLYFYPMDSGSRVLEKKDIAKLVEKTKNKEDVTLLLQEYGVRQPMMINTNFSLVGLRAYDPMIVYIFASEIKHGHDEIKRLSKRQKKSIPMILVIAGILGFAILMSNLSGIITSVGEQADKFLGIDSTSEEDVAPESEETLTTPTEPIEPIELAPLPGY